MLGLFDSGLGGLTVVRRVRELLPRHDLLFFADQAHVPYGDRTAHELRRLLVRNLAYLDSAGADAIVMACNTTCAAADEAGWPSTHAMVVDLIDSAAMAIELSGFRKIGVIATAFTAQSGAYGRKIRQRVPGARVTEIAAPALVPLVEAGAAGSARAAAAVAAVCSALPADVEAVVLACTHFPFLDEHFAVKLGSQISRIDPALIQAARTAQLASDRGYTPGEGLTRYVTNGNLDAFRAHVLANTSDASRSIEALSPVAL
ncbi:MAG: aspartate/glutamate racemase family protein [Candidatus Eremiobacteraeota bacterium]|nr:aspartate/glutamate racemase family protein [Candidatus Eremiobacteraeota bacterium]